MGEKKKKEETMKTVKKVLIVGACVLFVVLMVVSGMGSGWLTMFTSVRPGDSVVVDYTIFDAAGQPIVTSEKATYDTVVAKNRQIFGSKQLTIISNQTIEKPIYSVPVYPSNGASVKQLAIFSSEYNVITSAIIGMKVNEQKRIPIGSNISMTQDWSVEQLAQSKINLTDINVGDNFFMGVSDNPEAVVNNTTATTFLRIGEVASKSPEGIVVDFSYPSIDIRVLSINKQ
jgi:hypothetical protein